MKTLNVDLAERSYPIHIGPGILSRAGDLIPLDLNGRKVFIIYDRNVETHLKTLQATLKGDIHTLAVEGGEPSKTFGYLQNILDWVLDHHVDRQSVMIVMGGGVVGDLGGFAASIVMRGIPFVQIPTTLLAQVDSSVGGKTGINTDHGKNLVGTFYQPVVVLCDTDVLKTLPERELKAGYAEVIKYGLLGDADFYSWLEENGEKVLSLKEEPLITAIEKSCAAKAEIVGTDEREQQGGRRALLNLGHTFAHAFEAAAGYDGRLLHGEAVSIGMVLAFRLCAKMGLCSGQDVARIEKHLKSCGLKTEVKQIEPKLSQSAAEVTALMSHDKKAMSGKISFILVKGIGEAFVSKDVSMSDVESVIAESMI
jgi:3-dehydroquinate synthase